MFRVNDSVDTADSVQGCVCSGAGLRLTVNTIVVNTSVSSEIWHFPC